MSNYIFRRALWKTFVSLWSCIFSSIIVNSRFKFPQSDDLQIQVLCRCCGFLKSTVNNAIDQELLEHVVIPSPKPAS